MNEAVQDTIYVAMNTNNMPTYVIAIMAIIISIYSLIYHIRHSKIQLQLQKDHLIKSVVPSGFLDTYSGLNFIKVKLTNAGLGPMSINRMEILKNGKKVDQLRDLLAPLPDKTDITHFEGDLTKIREGVVVSNGSTLPILSIEDLLDSPLGREYVEDVKRRLKDVFIIIYFTDIFKTEELKVGKIIMTE